MLRTSLYLMWQTTAGFANPVLLIQAGHDEKRDKVKRRGEAGSIREDKGKVTSEKKEKEERN